MESLRSPDRSGFYGGAQGIGGVENSYNQDTGTIKHWINNYFGDALAWYEANCSCANKAIKIIELISKKHSLSFHLWKEVEKVLNVKPLVPNEPLK